MQILNENEFSKIITACAIQIKTVEALTDDHIGNVLTYLKFENY